MKRRVEPFSVWRVPWPRDTLDGEFVFLARAVDAVGNLLFPSEWTESDPLGRDDALKRFKAVQDWIAQAIAAKHVPFVLISNKGGEPRRTQEDSKGWSTFGVSDWNVADVSPFFRTCQMPGEFIGPETTSEPDWIYLDRAALVKAMTKPAEPISKGLSLPAVEKWFVETIVVPWQRNPTASNQITSRAALAQAQEKFPSLSKPAFTKIWGAHRPPEWSKSGPRKKRG